MTERASGSGVALIIPALNEAPVLGRTLRSIPQGLFDTIIVADNGSEDTTAEVAARWDALVVREPRRGYGAACLRAVAALPSTTEIVVFMQADLSEDPAEAPRLIEPIRTGQADLVLGTRTLGTADPGALLLHQRFGNWLATRLIWLLYGYRYSDLGPFRAIRRTALHNLHMQEQGYGWTIEMQVRALQCGLRVQEVPIHYRPRAAGVNKVSGSLRASLQAGLRIIWTVFRLWRRGQTAASTAHPA